MYFILTKGEAACLQQAHHCGSEGIVGEEEVIDVYLSSLVSVHKVAVGAVEGVEGEPSQVHGYKVEVHAFHTICRVWYLFCLMFSYICPQKEIAHAEK